MPRIWMSMVSSPLSAPLVALCQLDGTRPRLAKSSRTRGMTPGSALAWTAKQAAWRDCWRDSGRAEGASGNPTAWDEMRLALRPHGATQNDDTAIVAER